MTIRDDFTADEWEKLENAPIYAGMAIITGDPALTSVFKESAAMAKALIENPIPSGGEELVGDIIADFRKKVENKEKFEEPEFESKDPQSVQTQLYEYLGDVAAIVDAKAPAAEAAGYKEWVMSVAQSVAEAGKEGGFLGIGAVRVSDQEKAVLSNLRGALGLAE